jgi:hypothetical protein
MSSRRVRSVDSSLPPLLVRLIYAARHAPGEPADRTGHDAVIADLGHWALSRVASRGVLAPADDDAYKAIEAIAVRHLGYADARTAVRNALESIGPLERFDEIESAHNWLRSVSDDAYYYAGLACGVTLAHLSAIR